MEKEELQDKQESQKNNDNNTKDIKKDNFDSKIKTDEKENNTAKEVSPEEEISNLKDKLARTFAEMENQRRRFEKEKEDAFEYGGFSFAREALNLLDNLERSKVSLENDETLKNTEALNKVTNHFDIIYNDILSIFKKNNIEPIKSINEKLDPNLHQAMMEIEDDTKEPGIIIQEIQKGFTMKDRLLRPSLVGVSKKKQDNEIEDGKKNEQNKEKQEKN